MRTDRGVGRLVRSRARCAAKDLIRISCALLFVLISAGLSLQPASAERLDPTDHRLFHRLWARTELPVVEGRVQRAWLWGEVPLTPLMAEPNRDSTRLVQYFDKGGMQVNPDPVIPIGHPGYVMASPLAVEMVTGMLATGHQWGPSTTSIAGDADDTTGPTYYAFRTLRDLPPAPDGAVLTEVVSRYGVLSRDERLASYGVTAAHRVTFPGVDHQIASPFWEFIQANGLVYEAANYVDRPMIEDPWAMIGFPLTEAYWGRTKFGGKTVDVLIQVFERRVMTYMPHEPEGWRVQFANTGRHYIEWRDGGMVPSGLFVGSGMMPAVPAPDYESLRAGLIDMLASAAGHNALTVLDVQTGESISINGDRRQLAACTIKVPIMIAVAQDISAGKYTAADVEHLVIPMMGPSVNWPARELLRITGGGDVSVGVRRVNAIMRGYGVEQSLMTHAPGYWGEEHGYRLSHGEVENWLTTDDMARLLAGVWRGDGLTPAERDYVLWSLTLATPFLDAAFRAGLPAEAATFHKIGVLTGQQNAWNDAGIVVLERNGIEYAYVVAFLSDQGLSSYFNGYYLHQRISDRVWQTFGNVQ